MTQRKGAATPITDGHDSFGELVRSARTAAGISQRRLAAIANLDHSYLSKIETGRRQTPSVSVCRRIISALGVSADQANVMLRSARIPLRADRETAQDRQLRGPESRIALSFKERFEDLLRKHELTRDQLALVDTLVMALVSNLEAALNLADCQTSSQGDREFTSRITAGAALGPATEHALRAAEMEQEPRAAIQELETARAQRFMRIVEGIIEESEGVEGEEIE